MRNVYTYNLYTLACTESIYCTIYSRHMYLAISKCLLFCTLCTAMSTTMCGDARGLHLNEERKRKMTANDGVAWPAIRHTKRDRWQTKVSGFSHNVPCLLYGNILLYMWCSFTLYACIQCLSAQFFSHPSMMPSLHALFVVVYL